MKRLIQIAAAFVVAACSAEVNQEKVDRRLTPDGVFVVDGQWSGGGIVASYAHKAQYIINNRIPVKITTPTCVSACTYFLLPPTACMANPKTVFKFHAVTHAVPQLALGIPVPHKEGIQIVADDYNLLRPGLGDWYLANAATTFTPFSKNLTVNDMNKKFGVPTCFDG